MCKQLQEVEHTDTIILSFKPEISVAITKTLAELSKKPKLVIETSTVTPQTAKTCFEICENSGIAYVDAAIAGGVAYGVWVHAFSLVERTSIKIMLAQF